MSNANSPQRGPFAIASLTVVIVLGVLGVVYLQRANGGDRVAVATPTPIPTAVGSVSPVPGAATACDSATFGADLAPLNPPSDIHVYSAPPAMTIDSTKLYKATIHTAKGDIVMCLQPALAPNTVNVFVTLARNHFYDGLKFHRVVAGFVIQGGDPLGTGSGGPGFKFNDEPVKGKYTIGAVAMANSGANTNGSQFFVDIADDSASLQNLYNLFGYVESGQSVANSIAVGDVMKTVTVSESQ